ncbi:hypothetical protein [Pseudemcibacter aquimaris]|uniref:hypothetical protein n=1 Tax=Pseudemcibacter aquimaris TaxID=2857064 RepID=UPI0020129F90|nr:hypothetical protein [Pseudemcibacter aquimaris]MCC3859624.1 hypothetical protein [Pseudemcibacter aquimaris]WDU60019.1 hypothetical protein KW060_07085 [Pseudemcibacter aquimaris]
MRGKFAHQLAYIGSVLFIAGAFMPLASLPVIGDISYYRADNTLAIIAVAFAASVPLMLMMKLDKLSILGAIGAWLTLFWPVIKNMGGGNDNNFLDNIVEQASDPLQRFASELFSNIDSFSWGGYVFLGGLLILTLGSLLSTISGRK